MNKNEVIANVIMALGAAVLFALTIVVIGACFTVPIYFLFNWIGPAVFSLHKITFLQAWGLMVLCGFLFKSSTTNNTTVNQQSR